MSRRVDNALVLGAFWGAGVVVVVMGLLVLLAGCGGGPVAPTPSAAPVEATSAPPVNEPAIPLAPLPGPVDAPGGLVAPPGPITTPTGPIVPPFEQPDWVGGATNWGVVGLLPAHFEVDVYATHVLINGQYDLPIVYRVGSVSITAAGKPGSFMLNRDQLTNEWGWSFTGPEGQTGGTLIVFPQR